MGLKNLLLWRQILSLLLQKEIAPFGFLLRGHGCETLASSRLLGADNNDDVSGATLYATHSMSGERSGWGRKRFALSINLLMVSCVRSRSASSIGTAG